MTHGGVGGAARGARGWATVGGAEWRRDEQMGWCGGRRGGRGRPGERGERRREAGARAAHPLASERKQWGDVREGELGGEARGRLRRGRRRWNPLAQQRLVRARQHRAARRVDASRSTEGLLVLFRSVLGEEGEQGEDKGRDKAARRTTVRELVDRLVRMYRVHGAHEVAGELDDRNGEVDSHHRRTSGRCAGRGGAPRGQCRRRAPTSERCTHRTQSTRRGSHCPPSRAKQDLCRSAGLRPAPAAPSCGRTV